MRILRVAPWIYPDTKGGGGYHAHAMSRDQAAMGHDVTVLTTRESRSVPRIEETHKYTIVRVSPGITLLGNDVSPAVTRYLWDADTNSFDVIHAHSHYYFTTNVAALKRCFDDIPLAITNHGLYTQNAPEKIFKLYLRTVGRWTFNQADQIFCYTSEDKRRVRNLGVQNPIAVVSNGIDTERFTPDGAESELIDAAGPVVLFVGRFVEGKRPQLAVEAFAEVTESKSDAELYLCGEGPLREAVAQRAAELGVRKAVTFLAQVPYEEMPSVYRSAGVLILPSRAEGVPRTIMEALSSGVPVVSSYLPQVRSAFGEAVAYVGSEDGAEFGDRISDVLNRSSAVELDSAFQWEKTINETTAALQTLVIS